MKGNAQLICYVVLLLCAAFSGTTYYGYTWIGELKENLETLTNEYNELNKETSMMNEKVKAFKKAFEELDKLKVGVGENVDFYSEAQQAINRGGAKVLSNVPNLAKDGRISMKMSFTGDYYSLMKAFAELRGLPNVVRVVTMDVGHFGTAAPDIYINNELKADVLVEALNR